MLVVMRHGATEAEIQQVAAVIEDMGYEARVMPGRQRTTVGKQFVPVFTEQTIHRRKAVDECISVVQNIDAPPIQCRPVLASGRLQAPVFQSHLVRSNSFPHGDGKREPLAGKAS